MPTIRRREFIGGALVTSVALLAPRSANAVDARVEVLINEPIGTISPEIYGHFIEHLGGVIYDGVWVGEGSKIPNQNGIRKAFIETMRAVKAPLLRWPAAASPTATTGATASVPPPGVPRAPASGTS